MPRRKKLEMEHKPLFSIITVVFNGEKFIEDAIKSVLNQSYKNFEYIIIDGGSTDKTVEIIRKYDKYIRFWCSEKDEGIFNAMNKGIKYSSGELIGLLNADDIYLTSSLEEVAKVWENKVDIYYGDMKLVSSNMIKKIIPDINRICRTMSINHPATFINNRVYKDLLYDEKYTLSADYDFFLKCKLTNKTFKYVPKTLAKMRMGGASSDQLKTTKEVFLIQKNQINIYFALFRLMISVFKIPIRLLIRLILSTKHFNYLKGFRIHE